jgi:hypothetical protein
MMPIFILSFLMIKTRQKWGGSCVQERDRWKWREGRGKEMLREMGRGGERWRGIRWRNGEREREIDEERGGDGEAD